MTPSKKKALETPSDNTAREESHRMGLGLAPSVMLAAVAVLVVMGIAVGFISRTKAAAELQQATAATAIATVDVVYPTTGAPTDDLVLPGTTQAFTDAPIFARTNGYVKSWHADLGTRVKKGQVLAEIETPEVDQQLHQARADLHTAQANLRQAAITADRWQALVKTNAVSKQETDQAVNTLQAMKATVDSHASNVRRLEELQGFQKMYAPFDGVITARNTDIGALINAGASTPGQALFHLAAIHILRVFVAVPQRYAHAVRPGATASLTLDEFPGHTFSGTIARTSNAIDPASRTLLVEVEVENRNGPLLPGAYVRVHLTLLQAVNAVTVPANTLLFRSEGLRVGVVRNGRAELVPVTIGRDYGSSVEVLSSLQPTDPVIVNPSDSLISGTNVHVHAPPAQDAAR
jgi:RND family efflux transporter MFP subunit